MDMEHIKTIINLWVPQNVMSFMTTRGTVSYSRGALHHQVGLLLMLDPPPPFTLFPKLVQSLELRVPEYGIC